MVFLLREEREEREKLAREYSLLRDELLERSYRKWVISVILIIGSLLVAIAPVTFAFPLPVLSIVLIAFAFILHATSERVSEIGYHRLQELEELLKMSGTMKLFESEISGKWWYMLRRNIAYIVFVILIGTYLFMIIPNIWLLAFAVGAGLVLVIAKESIPNGKTNAKPDHNSDSAKKPITEATLLSPNESSAPITLKCKNWEEFLALASSTQHVSVTFRESDKMFEADAINGNQVFAYVGPVPELTLLLKEYLSKSLGIGSEKVIEGTIT
jgi:hypothetical protein